MSSEEVDKGGKQINVNITGSKDKEELQRLKEMEEKYLTEGAPDLRKLKPIIYTSGDDYWQLGDYLAKAFSIGKDFESR